MIFKFHFTPLSLRYKKQALEIDALIAEYISIAFSPLFFLLSFVIEFLFEAVTFFKQHNIASHRTIRWN